MKFRHNSQWTICLALLAVLALSSCGKKDKNKAVDNNPPPSTTPVVTTPKETPTTPTSKTTPGATTSKTTPDGKPKATTSKPTAKTPKSKPADFVALGGVLPTKNDCPATAPIKGNITAKRGNIYHDQKFPDYKKTKAEICFPDTATAEKAGFKAPGKK